ncbi:cobalamin biosynthesis protein [Ideonella dechloratans]|uniref:cobalamin biosynthesis protein n=1 Tax=Ideonella dechloratans TaxID=36863 RepID=UPI0035B2CAE3
MRIALGLGCDRGTPLDTFEQAVTRALVEVRLRHGWTELEVVGMGSITLKSDEIGMLALACDRGWPLRFFAPETLAAVPVPNPSETVRRHTGTPSVSEAAALLAAGASGPEALLLEKLRVKGADGRNATVSVARAEPLTTGETV